MSQKRRSLHARARSLSSAATPLRKSRLRLDLSFIFNAEYRTGLSGSLKAGITALPEATEGALILLADMPCVSAALIGRLIQAYEVSARVTTAVVLVRAGLRGNPVLIGRELFDAIKRIEGDRGARALLEAAGKDVLECLVDDEAIEIDIDTTEALYQLRALGPELA
jgi:molybdenum cofactor cytidylyltransferase